MRVNLFGRRELYQLSVQSCEEPVQRIDTLGAAPAVERGMRMDMT